MFIDTSGFFSLYSQEDEHHATAEEFFDQFGRRITTSYILAEYVALALIRGLPRTEVLAFSEEILNDDSVEIVWVNEDLHFRAVKLLRQRPDKRYSLWMPSVSS